MSFYQLPKVRKQRELPKPLTGISIETARKRYIMAELKRRELRKKLKKADRDISKYIGTIMELERKQRNERI